MVRLLRLLVPALTAIIVLLIGAIHTQIHHYQLARHGSTLAWLIALIALLWATSYAGGVNETGVPFGSRFVRSAGAVGAAVVIVALLQLVLRTPLLPLFDLGLSVVVLVPTLAALSSIAQRSLTLEGEQERVIALVDDEERERLTRDIGVRPEHHSLLVLAVAPSEITPTPEQPKPLEDLVSQRRITLVVLSREAQSLDDVVAQAATAHSRGVRIRTLSLFYDEWLGKLPLSELERIALLFDINEIHRPVYARMKRFLDVLLAIVGLPVLIVAIPFVALVDLMGNRGPLFFHQQRVGKGGAVFTIHKFRTMRPSDASTDWTSPGDTRLGAVGRMLRKLHIDELPQVWNVLRQYSPSSVRVPNSRATSAS